MTKIIKILIIKLLFFLFVLNNNVFSKPLPPGSGAGDVPVNILILLDSSESMSSNPFGGDALSKIGDVILLDSGDVLVGQWNGGGIVKMNYENEEIDTSFANDRSIFYGGSPTWITCTLEADTQYARTGTISSMAKSSNVNGTVGTEVIYAAAPWDYKVAAIDANGNCIEFIDEDEMGITHGNGKEDHIYPKAVTIRTIGGNDYLIVTGQEQWCTRYKGNGKCKNNNFKDDRPIMYSRNLTTGQAVVCALDDSKHRKFKWSWSITMDDGKNLYYTHDGKIHRIALTPQGGAYCPTGDEYTYETFISEYNVPTEIQIDPQDEDIIYVLSHDESSLQKLEFSEDRETITQSLVVGGAEKNNATPSAAANSNLSNSIAMYRPNGFYVSNDRVWTGGSKITIQEYDISGDSIKWKAEMGSERMNRMKGAQTAIEAVVTDSAFLQTANFGYGYWNAGEKLCKGGGKAKNKWKAGCEYVCNKPHGWRGGGKKKYQWGSGNCKYYGSWQGQHPAGHSSNCLGHHNSCLKVGIDKGNTQAIVDAVWSTKLAFGTDANAFSQIAYKYFSDPKVVDRAGQPLVAPDPLDREECQLNYVIVIGDGMWRHHDKARKQIVLLRQNLGVKTVFIAYGKSIKGTGEDQFEDMALAGSCDAEGNDCRGLIKAESPQDLLNKLKSEVARITASRLSFTAPSITASLSEGGDLYQAQFDYVQHGEWHGSLLRKGIREDGSIIHDMNHPDNYDIADILVEQAKSDKRRIWTTIPGEDYRDADWNNFTTANWSKVNSLFGALGEVVPNFHSSTSECKDDIADVLDTNVDDIKGLISFIRGYDYFAYEGCDNTENIRKSVLGDIYHSQIVEVGAPKANTNFTRNNQEAYWRSINNYGTWAKSKKNRGSVMYVGANDGALHAFATENVGAYTRGQEVWAFVPPFIAAKLPGVINDALDGYKPGKGGTNSIFGVDGSPVIHDVYIRGLDSEGDYQEIDGAKSWHTILMVTYGRGGEGFSVLDVTDPLTPYHMFSVYNDRSGTVYIADKDGNIDPHTYASGSLSMADSLEANRAEINQNAAEAADLILDADGEDFTNRDPIAKCQSNDDITTGTGTFAKDGDNACYKGKVWTFLYNKFPDTIVNNPALASATTVNEDDGRTIEIGIESITKSGNEVTFTLKEEHIYNVSDSDETDFDDTDFSILIASAGTENKFYDYSKLGETWAAPRIIRMPAGNLDGDTIETDRYVAVLSGGFGAARGVGSALFLVDLEDTKSNGGTIHGADDNNGPITIVDVNTEIKSGGVVIENDIHNSVPTDPIVITPDTFKGVSWRGAMVYLNDFEGKITKINLTNQRDEQNPVNLYDQTTLYNLGATSTNERFSYFGMDAAYGNDTRNLWLFGATGDFSDIGGKQKGMDNILYGLRDRDFPYFRHSSNGIIPSPITVDVATNEVSMNSEFISKALYVAQNAPHVDNISVCAKSRDDGGSCAGATKEGWVFQLDKPYDKSTDTEPGASPNRYRKASASPTVFNGMVYYPVYEPPEGAKKCNVGKAFICSANDECGTNTSKKIAYKQKSVRAESEFDEKSGCYYLQPGILSKLVIFGDKLFANITTDSDKQEDTLVTLLGGEGEISVYRGSWRENY